MQSSMFTFGKSRWRNVVLIPESVSLLQYLELLAEETAEGWPDHGTGERPLSETSDHEVHVVLVAVDRPEKVDDVILDGVVELVEVVDGRQSAVLPDLGVGGQPVVPARLYDGGNLVNSEVCKANNVGRAGLADLLCLRLWDSNFSRW